MFSSVKSLIWSDWIIAQGYFFDEWKFFFHQSGLGHWPMKNVRKSSFFRRQKTKIETSLFWVEEKLHKRVTLPKDHFLIHFFRTNFPKGPFLTNITNFGRIWQIKQMAATIDSYETLSLATFIYFSYFWSIKIMVTRKLWQLSKRKKRRPLWIIVFCRHSRNF